MSDDYRDDDLVVNYHDACIYGRDLRLLQIATTEWLNDNVIHYYLTRLSVEDPSVLSFDPAVLSFLMHQCDDDDELEGFGRSYDFHKITRLLLPINDNLTSDNWQLPGQGTHWSLLVGIVDEDSCVRHYHLDSVAGSNSQTALAVARKFGSAFTSRLRWDQNVVECRVPQQANGYDCGVHVLGMAEALLTSPQPTDSNETIEANVRTYIGPGFCPSFRHKVLEDILIQAKKVRG